MTARSTIDVGELRDLANRLFQHLLDAGISRIDVPQSQYWTIGSWHAFTSASAPDPTMSDVWDDLQDLRNEVEVPSPQDTTIVGHAFDHLAGLMKLIAHTDANANLTTRVAGGMS